MKNYSFDEKKIFASLFTKGFSEKNCKEIIAEAQGLLDDEMISSDDFVTVLGEFCQISPIWASEVHSFVARGDEDEMISNKISWPNGQKITIPLYEGWVKPETFFGEGGTLVVLNEQHRLLNSQKNLLKGNYNIVSLPATGISHETQKVLGTFLGWSNDAIVFASCPPVFLGTCVSARAAKKEDGSDMRPVAVFGNEKREKKELPGGKVISITALEGWELIEIC